MKELLIISALLTLLAVGLVFPAIATNVRFDTHCILAGKVKHLEIFMENPLAKPMGGPPLAVEIVYPSDGASLLQGTYTVLVSASAKGGVAKVELKIDGPESVGWTDITGNFDGTYYSYEWTVGTDGTYDLTGSGEASR